MKKDRRYKLNASQEDDINALKTFGDNYVLKSSMVRSVSYSDFFAADYYCLNMLLEYDNFKAKIIFNTGILFSENCLDIKYIFKNSSYEYSIYNIFNLFDIKDFNVYYYYNCYGKSFLTSAAGRLIMLTQKYLPEIERAGSPQCLKILEEQFRQDEIMSNGENWQKLLGVPSELDFTHIIYAANAGNEKRALSILRKKQRKNELNTIYERRLFTYLNQGYPLQKNDDFIKNTERQFGSLKRKVSITFFFTCIIFIVLTTVIYYGVTFKGAFVPPDSYINIANISIPYYEYYIFALLNGLFLFVFVKGFFEKDIILHFANENNKIYFSRKFDKDRREDKKIIKICNRILCLLSLLIALIFSITIIINVGFYDDRFKYCDGPFMTYETAYEDADIYLVESRSYTENGKTYYEEYSGYVYIIANADTYCELPECEQNSELWKTMEKIITEYDKEVIRVQSVDDVSKLYYGEE